MQIIIKSNLEKYKPQNGRTIIRDVKDLAHALIVIEGVVAARLAIDHVALEHAPSRLVDGLRLALLEEEVVARLLGHLYLHPLHLLVHLFNFSFFGIGRWQLLKSQ